MSQQLSKRCLEKVPFEKTHTLFSKILTCQVRLFAPFEGASSYHQLCWWLVIDLTKEALSHYGYQVTAFSDSTIALVDFQQHPDKYDLLVTDMTMPKMTGDELAQKIRLKRPDIPAIMCTGFSEAIDEQKAKALGFDAFLYKPINPGRLLGTIRKILDQKG